MMTSIDYRTVQDRTSQKIHVGWFPNRAQRLINAAGFLKPEALAMEAELAEHKWPAYHGLDPMEANLQFAKEYSEAFRAQFRADVCRNQAEEVTGLNIVSIIFPKDMAGHTAKGGVLTSVHAARQAADEVGVPYYSFCKFCMQFANNRNPRRIARPNQLIPQGKFREAWDKELEKFRDDFKISMPSKYRTQLENGRIGRPGCFGVVGAEAPVCQACPYSVDCNKLRRGVLAKMEEKRLRLYSEKLEEKLGQRNRQKADRERERRKDRKARALANPNAGGLSNDN